MCALRLIPFRSAAFCSLLYCDGINWMLIRVRRPALVTAWRCCEVVMHT